MVKDKVNTLADASKLITEKHIRIQDSALTQYIQSAINLLQSRGKNIDDYALGQFADCI